MKREALLNTKLGLLQRALGVPKYSAVGILEGLWHLTARQARAGDIGRITDEEIAFDLGWEGDPKALITALVVTRWIDEHPTFRLVVHDWAEHCDDATHIALARRIELFADGSTPKLARLSKDEKAAITEAYAAKSAELSKAKSAPKSVRTKAHKGAQMRTDAQESAEKRTTMPDHAGPCQAPPCHAEPLGDSGDGDIGALTGEQFFNAIADAIVFDFHGVSPGRGARQEYIRTFDALGKRGKLPNEEQLREAVRLADLWWSSDPQHIGRCQSAGPVVKALAAIVSPIETTAPSRPAAYGPAANRVQPGLGSQLDSLLSDLERAREGASV